MEPIEEDDELTGIYGRFFGEDGQARTEAPIPIAKLVQLFRSSDPRIRSKVARMVGRYSQYQAFVARRLQEDDPRVRANAIESLWGVDTEVARRFLETAVSDSHHRARANAIYGLYLLGNPSSIALLVKQASHPSASFRAAALWVINQTADPRFVPVARAMKDDPDEGVRRNAAVALTRMEEREQAERRKPSFRARILRARGPDPEWRTLRLLLSREMSQTVKATDFIIEENGHSVFRFETQHLNDRRALRVGIAIPEAKSNSTWVAEVEAALKPWITDGSHKDAFAIFRYSPGQRKPTYMVRGQRSLFVMKPEVVAEQLGQRVPAGDLAEGLHELSSGLFGVEAERALIVFAETAAGEDSAWLSLPADVLKVLHSSGVPLHAVTAGAVDGSGIAAACADVGGLFETASAPDAIAGACSAIFNSFCDRFEIRYLCDKPANPDSIVKVTVLSAAGWAEEIAVLV